MSLSYEPSFTPSCKTVWKKWSPVFCFSRKRAGAIGISVKAGFGRIFRVARLKFAAAANCSSAPSLTRHKSTSLSDRASKMASRAGTGSFEIGSLQVVRSFATPRPFWTYYSRIHSKQTIYFPMCLLWGRSFSYPERVPLLRADSRYSRSSSDSTANFSVCFPKSLLN